VMVDKRARIDDRDACMECGACAKNCAEGALTVGAGVGCAAAIIYGAIKGTEPSCDGSSGSSCC
jgi:ferredoxin